MPTFNVKRRKPDPYVEWSRSQLIAELEKLTAERENVRNLKNERADVQKLINEHAALKAECEKLTAERESVQKLINEHAALKAEYEKKLSESYWAQGKNERGAGRKPKLTDETAAEIRACRAEGMTFRAIADKTGLSLGLVHKAING